MTVQKWKPGFEEFSLHHVLATYLQDAARNNDVLENCSFNTRVNEVRKVGSKWELETSKLEDENGSLQLSESVEVSLLCCRCEIR